MRATEPGRTVSLGIWRDGSRRTLQVEVGSLPGSRDFDDERFDTPEPPTPPTPPAPPAPGDRSEHRLFIDGREVPDDEMDDKLKDMKIKMKGLDDMHLFDDHGGNTFMAPMGMSRGRLGVRVEKLNGDLAQALGASGDHGVLVTEVIEDTPAQRAGLAWGKSSAKRAPRATASPPPIPARRRTPRGWPLASSPGRPPTSSVRSVA